MLNWLMHQGKLILIAGPSGSGKGTLVAYLRQQFPDLFFPTSWTTRAPRPGEEDGTSGSGKRYHFVNEQEFAAHAAAGGFLEWARYGGNSYGTPAAEVDEALKASRIVAQELEIQGVEQLQARIPKEQRIIIFIDAGSWDELKKRILSRGEMSEDELEKRRLRFEEEQAFKPQADFVVENPHGRVEEAEARLSEIIRSVAAGS